MSQVRFSYPENRMKKLLEEPGGLTARDALGRAHQNIGMIRPQILAEVDRNIVEINKAAAKAALDATDMSARRDLYTCGNVIVGLAGSCGLDEVGKAAFSLCELVDRYGTDRWDAAYVAVHLSAITALREGAGTPQSRVATLEGLSQVVALVPRSED
jgi:hypothetical protein